MNYIKTSIAGILFLFLPAGKIFAKYSALFISPGFAVGKSNFPDLTDVTNKPLAGFDGGIGAEFGISKKISLQAEINLTTTGVMAVEDLTGAFTKLQNTYLTVPLLAKFYAVSGFSIFGGPQFGHLLYARILAHSNQNDIKLNATHVYKSFDFCAVAGIEYRFPAGFFASVRYQYGIANIDKSFMAGYGGGELKNRYFTFRLGYSISFTRLMKNNY